MLPVSWKIYRIFNYALLFYATIILLTFIVAVSRKVGHWPPLIVVVAVLVFLLIMLACGINLALFARRFNDKILSGGSMFMHGVSVVILCITWVALAYLASVALSEEFGSQNSSNGTLASVLAILIALMCLVQLYIIIFQFRVPTFLRNNQSNSMEKLIDSIGTTPST
ncbi:MAG TPA: hypothetical protein VFZ42_05510 [Chitinophagaceae bacterium]